MSKYIQIQSVGILLFDEVELLDFAGPLQVFGTLQYLHPELINKVETIGLRKSIKVSKSGMVAECNTDIERAGDYDILVIPGGFGTRPIVKDENTLKKIESLIKQSQIITSVCTGSLVLAKLGLLRGKKATTHHSAFDRLQELDETIIPDHKARYIDHGNLIVAQGVSAGIDMSFHLITKYFGKTISDDVRKYIEYYPEEY